MKCPRCNGNGSVPYPTDYEQGLFDETNCPLCGGSGEVLTNEEWFCQLPTEEKAEWLIEFAIMCIPCELAVLSERIKTYKNNILKWLKETHNG